MNIKDSNSEYGLIIRIDVILYQISPKAHSLYLYNLTCNPLNSVYKLYLGVYKTDNKPNRKN